MCQGKLEDQKLLVEISMQSLSHIFSHIISSEEIVKIGIVKSKRMKNFNWVGNSRVFKNVLVMNTLSWLLSFLPQELQRQANG